MKIRKCGYCKHELRQDIRRKYCNGVCARKAKNDQNNASHKKRNAANDIGCIKTHLRYWSRRLYFATREANENRQMLEV